MGELPGITDCLRAAGEGGVGASRSTSHSRLFASCDDGALNTGATYSFLCRKGKWRVISRYNTNFNFALAHIYVFVILEEDEKLNVQFV